MKKVLAIGMSATLAVATLGSARPAQALTAGEAFGALLGVGIGAAIISASDDNKKKPSNFDPRAERDRGYQDGLYRGTYNNRNNTSQYEQGFDQGLAESNSRNSSRNGYYSGDYGNNRTLTCYFNGSPQTCTAQISFAQAGTSVDITFPDGFTRRLVYDRGTFFDSSDARSELTVTQDARFFVVTDESNEYFEIPKAWL
ncbi:hypothetical protein S7335_133 [Synechococcus sp. PCC 7335]|uniref:hypothetical protein n=1 Tax=Synechococcus sp. (strain ATCC 29403 / PCC 7335) TaxID=91464 RepID=UPI00017EBCCB|nr:hypothetical protein [Synechococcus sp. PCC 7335]EDX82955.1 hypothetical protein S7335_133 [Synechococcus sp. PCC 7335]